MAIVLEGMDNSGKSTLAKSMGLGIRHPGPRPVTLDDILRCLSEQIANASQIVVMDRVTNISHAAYAESMPPELAMLLEYHRKVMFSTPYCVLIYCRPPIQVIKDFSKHVLKSYDDVDKINHIVNRAEVIVENYDRIMEGLPHAKYDYTNPDNDMLLNACAAQINIVAWNKWMEKYS